MNVLPVVGFGLLFLYVAKGNKMEKKRALKAAENIYRYGDLPDIIGDISVGERFTIELPDPGPNDGVWVLKATPPNNEIALEKINQDPVQYIFKGKKRGAGSIVFHRALSDDVEPIEVVEINIEVV